MGAAATAIWCARGRSRSGIRAMTPGTSLAAVARCADLQAGPSHRRIRRSRRRLQSQRTMRGFVERETGCLGMRTTWALTGSEHQRGARAPRRGRRLPRSHAGLREHASGSSSWRRRPQGCTCSTPSRHSASPRWPVPPRRRRGRAAFELAACRPRTPPMDGLAGGFALGVRRLLPDSHSPDSTGLATSPSPLRPTVAGFLSLRSAPAIRAPITTPATARQVPAIETRRHLGPTSERRSRSPADRRATDGRRLGRRGGSHHAGPDGECDAGISRRVWARRPDGTVGRPARRVGVDPARSAPRPHATGGATRG